MKISLALILAASFALTGCSANLALPEKSDITTTAAVETHEEQMYTPLNYKNQTAMWFPYVDFPEYMQSRSEQEFTEAVTDMLTEASENGINTIYFHIHPEGDAYYSSEIHPKGTYLDENYDPLKIVLDIAHSMGISVHGWINPYRLQTAEKMETIPDSYIVKQWIESESPMVVLSGDRWYLNPIYHAVNDLISRTVQEIIENYPVDGIHIDDYFYPTDDESFDKAEYEAYINGGGTLDLSSYRREVISSLVKNLCSTVKAFGEDKMFSVSPSADIDKNMNVLFADVKRWGSEEGFCDMIIPQIYFGFENESKPFYETASLWREIVTNSSELCAGLALYKVGKEDGFAGKGKNEWIENKDIISGQIAAAKELGYSGACFYSVSYMN